MFVYCEIENKILSFNETNKKFWNEFNKKCRMKSITNIVRMKSVEMNSLNMENETNKK